MNYEVDKLRSCALFCQTLAEDLEDDRLTEDDKKLAEADLVSHIERLLIVSCTLKGVKIDLPRIQAIIALI